ncbi:MAG: PspC domain-containing protein [bacterium]|nr:MAG: PspC domain-containing protein [bacterium]
MKRLYRSRTDRKIAGIFGGLGELYEVDPNLLRLLAVLIFLISGFFPVLVTYIVAWVIIPEGLAETVSTSKPGDTRSAGRKNPGNKPAAKTA